MTSQDPFRSLVAGALDQIKNASGEKKIIDVGEVDFRPSDSVSEGLKTMERRAENESGEQQTVPQAIITDQPQNSYAHDILKDAVKGEYQYAKLGLGLGLSSIIGGSY